MSVSGRIVRRLPVWVRANPMDCTLVMLGIPGGVLSLAGVARSSALAEILPWWGPALWSAALVVGCAAWLVGLTSVREADGRLVITRMPAMLLGLQVVSMSALTYGVMIVATAGWAGLVASLYVFVVGAGTWIRRVDLLMRFRGQA